MAAPNSGSLGAAAIEDVSASQAFIYRYELLHHGFDAAAADEAWRGHDDGGEHWAEMHRHMDGGHHMDGAPFEHRADVDAHLAGLDQHMAAIDRWGRDADRHFGDLEQHVAKNDERLASVDQRVGEIDSRAAPPCCHGAHGGDYHYERHGMTGDGAYGYSYERRERRSSGGWSYGDGGGWDRRGGYWDRDWRDGNDDHDLQYSGRDAHGYLVWPGKSPSRGRTASGQLGRRRRRPCARRRLPTRRPGSEVGHRIDPCRGRRRPGNPWACRPGTPAPDRPAGTAGSPE